MPTTTTKIVIIEDHAFVRGLVERVAEEAFAKATVNSARDGKEGLDLCRDKQPSLVLLDLELPDTDGFDLVDKIREAAPAARILVFSAHTEPYTLHRVRLAGVEGFVDKNHQTPEMLVEALRTVAAGQDYFSPGVQQAMARFTADPHSFPKLLSQREQDLLRILGQGWPDQKIAAKVGLQELTVRNHRRNIMMKLGIHSTPELIHYAVEHGFSRMRPD